MKQLLDKRFVGFGSAGQKCREVAHIREMHYFAGASLIHAGRVDRLALLVAAEAPERVEILEGKPQRIDHPMT